MVRGQLSEALENTEYRYGLVSGQQVLEVSGAVKLHSVVLGRKTSGQFVTVFDSAISGRFLSGGVSVVGLIYGGDGLNVPTEINYDVGLSSGLVIIASGANWMLTAIYK